MGKAVRKMMNRQLAAAWDCWKDKYLTWRDYVMPKLKLAAGRMMNRIAAVAFITWHENVRAVVEAGPVVYSHHHIHIVYWYTKHPGPIVCSHHHIYIVYWYTKHPWPIVYSHHHIYARLNSSVS